MRPWGGFTAASLACRIYLIGHDGKVLRSWRGEFKTAELDTAIEAALREGLGKP